MSSYEVEVTVNSGKDLKNVNWRHGNLRPYAILWVDPAFKCSTKADVDGDTDPVWNEKLTIPIPGSGRSAIDDAVLCIDLVHADADDDVKALIGSARLPLAEVVDKAGIGGKVTKTLNLKRPSGRPQGKLDVKVCVREAARYYDRYPAPGSYGVPNGQVWNIGAQPYGGGSYPYGAPPLSGYPLSAPPAPLSYGGYPYSGAPQQLFSPPYGQAAPYSGKGSSYGVPAASRPPLEENKSKFGLGTGLAVGAAAGLLGGLALAEGAEYLEDKIAEKVEENLGYDCDDF